MIPWASPIAVGVSSFGAEASAVGLIGTNPGNGEATGAPSIRTSAGCGGPPASSTSAAIDVGLIQAAELMPAVEPRFKAVVLLVAGLENQQGQPEVEPINFLPHITIPVLMLNGQYDHYFPVETAQRPMFRLLGTPPDRKRQVIVEGGHFVPRTELVGETLGWLDRYLGPVH